MKGHVQRTLAVPGRRLGAVAIECDGEHWVEPVACRYATGSSDMETP